MTTPFTITGGDLDPFLDNCETANVTFTVENNGTTLGIHSSRRPQS